MRISPRRELVMASLIARLRGTPAASALKVRSARIDAVVADAERAATARPARAVFGVSIGPKQP